MPFPPRFRLSKLYLLVTLAGCDERDRITFPNLDGTGPEVTITVPAQDTTVPAGPAAIVGGVVADLDGIDTVYFDVQGGLSTFPPFKAQGADTVNFSLPLTTAGLGGTTVTVAVSGINLAGIRGDTAFRQVTIQ